MAMRARAVALVCAVLLTAGVAAYTVDCNPEYTDCDTELSKIADDDELPTLKSSSSLSEEATTSTTTTIETTQPTTKTTTEIVNENKTEPIVELQEVTDEIKPKPRLLNLNVDELQNFANALHNQTEKGRKKLIDLSDVNLDDDDEEPPKIHDPQHKGISDKFFSNLQAPFHPLISVTKESEDSECKDNGEAFKVGEKVDRNCEETCECMPGGTFECSPRCKHPYIRQGRRLDDPLCFESPVDECCSIVACATGSSGGTFECSPRCKHPYIRQRMRMDDPLCFESPVDECCSIIACATGSSDKVEVCKYGNETYSVGARWHRGCEQTCVCEANGVVSCNPRCKPIVPSEKCISVQDPSDACCKIQVCDVSQDGHELPENITTTTTAVSTSTVAPTVEELSYQQIDESDEGRTSNIPAIAAEPIGSIKVLQNNSVQVNLMHLNNSEDPIHLLLSSDGGNTFKDVELKYSNLILNLEGGKDYILKTKETGTKFNFTITTSDAVLNEVEDFGNATKVGCWHDGAFYAVGEEFRIGCTELCECTGPDTQDCAALVCPNHVGLEIMSKGCVKWAPSPPAQPPNCCPRSARCLSDGTCHYNGVPVPNWSEVPIALTGCEQRCFCENGDLDCQEICTPLPPVPPQTLRCPPMHRPAPVNISDEDCCKQWGCLPSNAGTNGSSETHIVADPFSYATPKSPIIAITSSQLDIKTSTPSLLYTHKPHFYDYLGTLKTFSKFLRPSSLPPLVNYPDHRYNQGDYNATNYTHDGITIPIQNYKAEPSLNGYPPKVESDKFKNPESVIEQNFNKSVLFYKDQHSNAILPESIKHSLVSETPTHTLDFPVTENYNISDATSYFLPTFTFQHNIPDSKSSLYPVISKTHQEVKTQSSDSIYFWPNFVNRSEYVLSVSEKPPNHLPNTNKQKDRVTQTSRGKIVSILKSKDAKPSQSGRSNVWIPDEHRYVVPSNPNPYETVMLRPVLSPRAEATSSNFKQNPILDISGKPYSTMDLENLLNQMEINSEVNRNLGRSADKNQENGAAGHHALDYSGSKPLQPPFIPPTATDVHYPQEDDYDQNNIHRPLLPGGVGLPGLPQVPSSFGDMNKKLTVISIEADSPSSIKMLLGLPSVLVGLRGSVDLRYTDKADEDISNWYSQVFAPADEILTTPRLEFRLTGLKPSTAYKVRGKLFLHNLPVSPESETYTVRTFDQPSVQPIEEKRRDIDSNLQVIEVNDTTAHVSWRHFTEDELQFIDGIQVRYRPVGTPIYSMTELLHHSRSAAELQELRPGSRYEASLVLIPPPRATTELHDPGKVEFTTQPYNDPYNWTAIIEVRSVGSQQAELTWRGVPSPAERWVRVYRAAHACGNTPGKEHDEFRLAARDQPPSVTLSGLEPDSRCRVWLELFLTNGKVKTSNVLEINTKSLDTDNPIDNEIEASSAAGRGSGPRGDYYTALVGVGVVAALGALTSLLLLLVVVRRHRPRSVPITPVPTAPRESSLPPYDNPAYKLELQQETMDL